MIYKGKLYGKIGSRYIPLKMTSDDVRAQAAEIKAMRESIKEAASHLSGFLGFHADGLSLDQVRALSATLDKLQPFLPDAPPPKP